MAAVILAPITASMAGVILARGKRPKSQTLDMLAVAARRKSRKPEAAEAEAAAPESAAARGGEARHNKKDGGG